MDETLDLVIDRIFSDLCASVGSAELTHSSIEASHVSEPERVLIVAGLQSRLARKFPTSRISVDVKGGGTIVVSMEH